MLSLAEKERVEEKITSLDREETEYLFRCLCISRVVWDVESYVRENHNKALPDSKLGKVISEVTERLVNGEFDKDISYWDNIRTLVDEEITFRDAG